MKENPENFQYNSCIARGICSVNPRTSSLIIILIVYLRLAAKYCLKLLDKEPVPPELKELILNTVAITVTGQEFNEQSFKNLISEYKKLLPEIFTRCNELFNEDFFKNEPITSSELFTHTENIIDAIKLGERILRKAISVLSPEIRDFQQIIMILAKSLSINMLDLESLGYFDEKSFVTILELLDFVSAENTEKAFLKSKISDAVKTYKIIAEKLRESQEERYGKQTVRRVSYSTTAAKAVLVVGSNIRELETILEKMKNYDIDVYTHDEMMLAHTFPKFSEYKRLKGQYGQGIENCLIDFATFPGPIILTKHSLHNIDNLYRGRLFTTDYTVPQGVIKIENDNYRAVIDAALASKGFKKGKICESIKIGYDYPDISDKIDLKINSNIKRVFIFGANDSSNELKSYFEKIIKSMPDNTLVISFSYEFEHENLIYINTCYDNYAIMRIFNKIRNYGLPITVFIPRCSVNNIPEMIYFSENQNVKVFSGKCTPIVLNPSLMQTLKNVFNINSITVASRDLQDITDS